MPRRSRVSLGRVRSVIASIAISGFGTWSYNVGIAVYAYQRTHSPVWVAVVTVGRYLPAIVLSWSTAALVDRLPRRGLVLAADTMCAAIMAILALMTAAGAPVWEITIVAALSSTASRIQTAGVLSLASDLVVESQLNRASVVAAAFEAVATAAGAAAASALLIRFAASDLFWLNAATFALSALLITRVPSVPVRRERHRADGAPAQQRSVHVRVWPLQAARAVAACVYGADVVLLTVVAARQFHSGTTGYGWLLAAAGFGGIVVLAPARRLIGASAHIARLSTAGMIAYSLPLLAFAAHPPIVGGLAVQVVRGAGAVIAVSSLMGALQWVVPSTSAGRVFGTTQSLILVGTCAGSIAAPLLLHTIGFTASLVAAAVAPCVAQLILHPVLDRFQKNDADALAALDPRLATLRGLDLLHDASRSTLYAIADSIGVVSNLPGSVIVAEGEAADAFYVLVEGSAEVTGASGIFYRTLTAPNFFGEIGLLRDVPRTATVTALSACELWRVPGDRFLNAISDAGISGALMDTVGIRLDASTTNHLRDRATNAVSSVTPPPTGQGAAQRS